jgi:hypothetical protein
MNAKKLGMGAAFAGAGALAFHSFGPKKLHEKCQSACAGQHGGSHEKEAPEEPAARECCPQPADDTAEVV